MASNIKEFRVLCYLGYASNEKFFLKGRIVDKKKLPSFSPNDTKWRNLMNTRKYFTLNGLANVNGVISVLGEEYPFTTDDRGFFKIHTENGVRQRKSRTLWLDFYLRVAELEFSDVVDSRILLPAKDARFGIITDIDDTILHTNVSNKLSMMINTFFKNAHTRISIRGASQLCRSLNTSQNNVKNPFFYVSKSPWNLYHMLRDFFKVNRFPKGPLLLRDWRKEKDEKTETVAEKYKFKSVENIITTYPKMKFILLGDSNELDTLIYSQLYNLYPKQIEGIYIRLVNSKKKIQTLSDEDQKIVNKAPIKFFRNYQEAKFHATLQGFTN